MIKIYLAGQWNEHDNNWKKIFDLEGCDFHDPEIDSDQISPNTYFPDDLKGIKASDYMVANPGIAPSEATWMEIGYFYSNHVNSPGDFCDKLIIVWQEARMPKWSKDFIDKTGFVVSTAEEAKAKLISLLIS